MQKSKEKSVNFSIPIVRCSSPGRLSDVGCCSRGQLLVEIIVAVAAFAIVGALAGQMIFVGLKGNKTAGDRDLAAGLMLETFEAVRGASDENWQNLFGLAEGTTQYHPEQSSGKWSLIAGSEVATTSTIAFTRYFTVQNVCRDDSTRVPTGITDSGGVATTCTTSGGSNDPSTQQVSVAVSWANDSISASEYVSRWRNKVCGHTQWTGGSTGVKTCGDTTYDSGTPPTNLGTPPWASLQIQ
ncbi:hypothetical protein HZA43_00545 [Candidatus Peregrinibacteria bacterium]|nr:hypothetical protein [Candidatus Peregrinibacteria bacterium]